MKQLLREVHRRSLWQVALIYLVGAAAVFWAVRVLTGSVGLPPWTPSMALLLLVIAFPFTVAAAFVRDPGDDANALTGLVAELHRRSLWQVMGIFLAGSWGALQVVEVMTETAGLPGWTPTMALVLLLVGLPVCLATAFVQEGLPGRAEAEATPEPTRHGAEGLLTWRNALIGAVGAFALLGLSTGGYLVMWTLGIGPLGNLVAQGVITDGERVILADFTDGTGEGYADPITEALRIDLLEAAVFDVVDDSEIRPALEFMRVESGAALTPERARDVAARLGVAAVLDGELTSLGTGYILTATLRATDSGRSLAGFRVTAEGPDDLIRATDRLSQDIREKSGESLRTIRAGKPLEQVTTTSMEALKLYTEALVAWNDLADLPRARMLLEQALLQDSTFAMAWRQLRLSQATPERALEAIANAYRYRDKVPDLERYVIEGQYFGDFGDRGKAIEAYENALLIDPDELRALNNGAGIYRGRADWDRARELLVRAVEGPGVSAAAFLNLHTLELFLGRLEDARRTLQNWEEMFPGNLWASRYPAALSFAEGNVAVAVTRARARMDDTDLPAFERAWSGRLLGRALSWSGQLDEARSTRQQADELARQAAEGTGWQSRVETAYDEALLGDAGWAQQYVGGVMAEEFYTLPASERHHLLNAMTLAMVGDPDAAERTVRDWQAATPEERRGPTFRAWTQRARLQARVARGESSEVSERVERLLADEGCSDACWLFERAVLNDRIEDPERAAALYERVRAEGFGVEDGNIVEILHAKLRLGPLYEEMGDTARAIEAYQRIVDQWADADARGMETVRAFRERIAALGG
ncbi:MAG: hypothetical protein OEO79_08815 [Gemmatimonadota bacterium]|nr:hypothetical protein [Gemmatimonadota bacterium]